MPTVTANQGIVIPVPGDPNNVPSDIAQLLSGGSTPSAGLENRLVERYESAVDRTARNPTPNEGELSYLNDANRYETYTGAAWIPLLSVPTYAVENTVFSGVVSVAYTTAGAPVVGAIATVPLSGQLRVDWASLLDNTGAANTSFVAPQLNAGGVVGAGATLTAAADIVSISNFGQSGIQSSSFHIYTGLTPGNIVNAFLMHRVDGGGGAFNFRKIALTPS